MSDTPAYVGGADASPCRLLLIDDDDSFVHLCKRYLRKSNSNNYHVDSAGDAKNGLDLCLSRTYDCLIVDYRLPDSIGTVMLETLRQSYGDRAIPPAIILTALAGSQAATDAIRSEAVDFMVKSDVTPTSLAYAIDIALSKSALHNEVRKNYEQLQSAYGELRQKAEEITRFYHTVSHEVKTPITAMQEFLLLITDEIAGPISDGQRELLSHTTECCDTIVSHFNDLLEISRFDTNKLALRTVTSCPNSLIRFCVMGAQGLARSGQIELIDITDTELPGCELDERRIKQVISNLIDNAIKFTTPGGRVTVSAAHDATEDCVNIQVCDTGRGIPEADTEKIFERLYQVNLGSEHEASSGGLGLGLAISREIVRRHGGDINVESILGAGTTFVVKLPRVQALKRLASDICEETVGSKTDGSSMEH